MSKLKIEEVAVRLGVSAQTINRWYKFKKLNPDNAVCELLPEFTKEKTVTTGADVRYWDEEDLPKIIEFKSHLKLGRTGIMGKYNGLGTGRS